MKKFHLTQSYALINFDASNCDTETDIIQSKSFEMVLTQFIKKIYAEKHPIMKTLPPLQVEELLNIYKLLLIYDTDFIASAYKTSSLILYKEALYQLTELFYDDWRKVKRFGMMQTSKQFHQDARASELVAKADHFNEKILSLYRTISQKLMGFNYNVYRQLPAGVNANLLYTQHRFSESKVYANLQNVGFITGILTRPPFIAYTKSNTRTGLFQEIFQNPIEKLHINKLHYLVFPLKVGKLLAFVYIHRDFLHHGIGLSNLFELAKFSEFKDKKPDLIYIYGMKENEFDCTYYHDVEENIYLGFVSRLDKNDYFGYLKKMLLTLHNVAMIDQGNLPLHGAMVSITLNNEQVKNIVIVGDSGAGKSETLEALRVIGKKYINQMKIVFDDMGCFLQENNRVYAQGSEIGAFVRLDDLDTGYAYQEMDRAIFLNPNQKNARVIIPISSYQYIIQKHAIDMLVYANNYEANKEGIRIFKNKEEALAVFKQGRRIAKGTTSEVGLVNSYFANPFGPMQKQKQTDRLLVHYFSELEKQGVIIGEIYTKLAIEGYETKGPQKAAALLLDYLMLKK